MSWLSHALGFDKKPVKLSREETLYLVLKLLKPDQRAALRVDLATALRQLGTVPDTIPVDLSAIRDLLNDFTSAVNR